MQLLGHLQPPISNSITATIPVFDLSTEYIDRNTWPLSTSHEPAANAKGEEKTRIDEILAGNLDFHMTVTLLRAGYIVF